MTPRTFALRKDSGRSRIRRYSRSQKRIVSFNGLSDVIGLRRKKAKSPLFRRLARRDRSVCFFASSEISIRSEVHSEVAPSIRRLQVGAPVRKGVTEGASQRSGTNFAPTVVLLFRNANFYSRSVSQSPRRSILDMRLRQLALQVDRHCAQIGERYVSRNRPFYDRYKTMGVNLAINGE